MTNEQYQETINNLLALLKEKDAALQRFIDDAINVDLGGGDAIATTCESLEVANEAIQLQPDNCKLVVVTEHCQIVNQNVVKFGTKLYTIENK